MCAVSRSHDRMYYRCSSLLYHLDIHLCRGGCLERGLRRVINDIPVGSLLIQSEAKHSEPLLLHLLLPVCIRERRTAQDTWVFVLDAQVRRFALVINPPLEPLNTFLIGRNRSGSIHGDPSAPRSRRFSRSYHFRLIPRSSYRRHLCSPTCFPICPVRLCRS